MKALAHAGRGGFLSTKACFRSQRTHFCTGTHHGMGSAAGMLPGRLRSRCMLRPPSKHLRMQVMVTFIAWRQVSFLFLTLNSP